MGGLLFWRKTKDTGTYRLDGTAQTHTVEVDEDHPLPVQLLHLDDNEYLPVRIPEDSGYLPAVSGSVVWCEYEIPGIGTGAAYADGEAFGTAFQIHNVFRADKLTSTLVAVTVTDFDKEALQIDFPLFAERIAGTADNSAFAPSDAELATCRGVASAASFYSWNANAFGQSNSPLRLKGNSTSLYTQAVIRGAANIAAGKIPRVRFCFEVD